MSVRGATIARIRDSVGGYGIKEGWRLMDTGAVPPVEIHVALDHRIFGAGTAQRRQRQVAAGFFQANGAWQCARFPVPWLQ